MLILGMYVITVLGVASIYGRTLAFLEFTGVFNRPEIIVTLNDGKIFQEGRSLYLIAKSEGVYYVAARSTNPISTEKTWQVPQAMVRHIEFHSGIVNPTPFFDYLK
jgi:hypothetical protein